MDIAKSLVAKVNAFNRANDIANRLYPALTEALKGCIGKKVTKLDGTLTAKLEEIVKPILEKFGEGKVTIFRERSHYTLGWNVKANEEYKREPDDEYGIAMYAEATVYVGRLKDMVMTELSPARPLRTDYTAEEVTSKRETYRKLRDEANEALSQLSPFGEYDR